MAVLSRRYIDQIDFVFFVYLGRHVLRRGPRARSQEVSIKLHSPRKIYKQIPGSYASPLAEVVDFTVSLASEDVNALPSEIICSTAQPSKAELVLIEGREAQLRRLKAVVPKEALDDAMCDVIEFWCRLVGITSTSTQERAAISDYLCRSSPDALKDAMLDASTAYRRKPVSEIFGKIISFLVIHEELIDDTQADLVQMLKGRVYEGREPIPEKQGLRFLRTASYLQIPLHGFLGCSNGLGRGYVPLSVLRSGIGRACSRHDSRLPPARLELSQYS